MQEIRNVKGNETFSRNGDSLVWDTEGADIYYQGETEEELPVEVNLTWYFDGKEVKPEELGFRCGFCPADNSGKPYSFGGCDGF